MNRPNIVLIVMDAVRADHLSCYGYDRDTTPELTQLADKGVLYENAFSNSNYTAEAHPPIFTGLLPSRSGAYRGNLSLPSNMKLLSERLHDSGYRTFSTSAGSHLRKERGYDRGFDTFQETHRIQPKIGTLQKLIREKPFRDQFKYTLSKGPDEKTLYKFISFEYFRKSNPEPFFAFFNCKTTHSPFNPPRPYKSEYCPDLQRPKYEVLEHLYSALGRQPQSLPDDVDVEQCLNAMNVAQAEDSSEREWDVVKAWYDGSIKYLDSRIGELVTQLDQEGLLNDTYLIITADHGEMLGEHGLGAHSHSLYEELLRIPLIIRPPTGENSLRITDRVSLIDLFATILDMADISVPDREHSQSLLPFQEGIDHEYTFAEVSKVQGEYSNWTLPSNVRGPLQSIRDDMFKLIRSGNGNVELYNWREDPAEQTDISSEFPDVIDEMTDEIKKNTKRMDESEKVDEIDDEVLHESLKHLGYK